MSATPPEAPPTTTPSDWVAQVRQVVQSVLSQMGLSQILVGKVSASYSSGNPAVVVPPETSATAGTKTLRVTQPYNVKGQTVAASDAVVMVQDNDGNRVIIGKAVDVSTAQVVDADTWVQMAPRTPGTTVTHGTANTEQNTTSATYVKVKEFQLYLPGRYRFTFGLARTAATAQAILRRRYPDGSYQDVSTVASSTSTYPSFATQTLDMNVSTGWDEWISIWLLNTAGPSQTSYINNAVAKSSAATSAPASNDVVIQD